MIFKVRNYELIKDREKTFLTVAVAVGGGTASAPLTVKAIDANAWANNDYIIVGEIGTGNAEILQINGAVSDGTSLIIDNAGSGGTRFAHSINEPVYRIDFAGVEFSRATTETGSKTCLSIAELQVDDEYTRYEDTTNSTGYGFVRFDKPNTPGTFACPGAGDTFSSYSDAIPYTGYTPKSLGRMLRMVGRHLNLSRFKPTDLDYVSDEDITEEINEAQRDIAHERLWPFYEDTFSASRVAYQRAYTIDDDVVVGKVHAVTVESEPLAKIDTNRFNLLQWDSSTTGEPTHFRVWNNKLELWPLSTSAVTSTTLNGALTAVATSITATSTSGFSPSGRIAIGGGICDTSGTAVSRVSGQTFVGMSGTIAINGIDYTISSVTDLDNIVLTATAGTQTGVSYKHTPSLEVVDYTYKSSTVFYGCTRGVEETTATAFLTATTVTERDIIYTAHREPNELVDIQDETLIPDPAVLAYKADMELAIGKLHDQVLHDRYKIKYEQALERLRDKFGKKATLSFYHIKDKSEVVSDAGSFTDPNRYPTGIS